MLKRTRRSGRFVGKHPLVLVEWIDANRLASGWMDLSEIPDPYPHKCVSVGFLVSENSEGKILVPTIGDVEHPENSLRTTANRINGMSQCCPDHVAPLGKDPQSETMTARILAQRSGEGELCDQYARVRAPTVRARRLG
jgi:hypothetical protein